MAEDDLPPEPDEHGGHEPVLVELAEKRQIISTIDQRATSLTNVYESMRSSQRTREEREAMWALSKILDKLKTIYRVSRRNSFGAPRGAIEYLSELFFKSSLEEMLDILTNLTGKTRRVDFEAATAKIEEKLIEQLAEVHESLTLYKGVVSFDSDYWERRATFLADELRTARALSRADLAATEAEESLNNVRSIAQQAAEAGLGSDFAEYASRHNKAANVLRLTVIAITLLIASFLAWSLGHEVHKLTWLELMRRLSITLPFGALAAYLAREANAHRNRANEAGGIAVRLLTIESYTASLSEDMRDQIRGEFGKWIFGAPQLGGQSGESSPPEVAGQLGAAVEITKALQDVLKGGGGK
ncbi:hypothetical protein [Actinomadura opuntiae]|uniref:hypothetical protein n=1 Tax=Actinomadura sp. OS1-43 TaxID=604315 RepID=UPI00255AEFE5|nr:hypothetical protein [Actinomadura sp. OS1-43]MDL4814421.1 hypothetical protein [Actinomadura sp. OS1-43]